MTGPFFEDLETGTVFVSAAMTVTDGHAAWFLAFAGDRNQVHLDDRRAQRAGVARAPLNTALIAHIAIGDSTVATREVVANLFYTDVAFHKPVCAGATLRTRTEVLGRADATARDDRAPRGKVLLGITLEDEHGEPVLTMARCALVLKRTHSATGLHDDMTADARSVDWSGVAENWRAVATELTRPPISWLEQSIGSDDLLEPVTGALELVRLTGNEARAHRDTRYGQAGRRLVYGGHTVSLAQAALTRIVGVQHVVVGWQRCSHPAPVFEGDVLSTAVTAGRELFGGDGMQLTTMTAVTVTTRAGSAASVTGDSSVVQQWSPIVLTAEAE